MKTRHVVGAVAATALTFALLSGLGRGVRPEQDEVERSAESARRATAALKTAGACDPKAKPAKLDFTLKDMNGKDVKLAAYKGKVILLNFWATWCGPCRYEIPALVELQTKYKEQGLVVLGVSTDDTVDKLKPFASRYKMNYPVLVGLDRDDFVQDAYGPVWGIPMTVMIGRGAQICKKHTGVATKEQLEREIKGLL